MFGLLGDGLPTLRRLRLGTLVCLNLGARTATATGLGRRLLARGELWRLGGSGLGRTGSHPLCCCRRLGLLVSFNLGARTATSTGLGRLVRRAIGGRGSLYRRCLTTKGKLSLRRSGFLHFLPRSTTAPRFGLLICGGLAIGRRRLGRCCLGELLRLDLGTRTPPATGLWSLLRCLRRGSAHRIRGCLVCHADLTFHSHAGRRARHAVVQIKQLMGFVEAGDRCALLARLCNGCKYAAHHMQGGFQRVFMRTGVLTWRCVCVTIARPARMCTSRRKSGPEEPCRSGATPLLARLPARAPPASVPWDGASRRSRQCARQPPRRAQSPEA